MIIGVPREVKDHESRVGLVPHGVSALVEAGHEVLVETRAGALSSLTDEEYREAGARIVPAAAEVWHGAQVVVKVKEPQPSEYGFFRPDLTLAVDVSSPLQSRSATNFFSLAARSLDLVRLDGEGLTFFACKGNPSGEDILKALRDLIVHTTLYRAFLEDPRKFGYNTGKSPLLLEEAGLRWELVAPKDMINPRKSEMRWGERDTQAMQRLMRSLGVGSFSLGRRQAEAEALQANISKDHFSGGRARQWFEHRVTVLIA